ncbi:hypothetical protein B0H12DRAFT_1267477 [Mycena haematopus]|nr:hypothetical protein B0H12DRAFT_1267477 [Mycena haematopus]
MAKFFGSLLASLAPAAVVSAALATGHYQIHDFQGRCVDYVPASTNNYIPVVTTPCAIGIQTQIWNVVADTPFAPTYVILANQTGAMISYASSTAIGAEINGEHQQLQLITQAQAPPGEDLFLSQIDPTHWTLGDTFGGGRWTAWAARPNVTLGAPMTLEDVGSSTGPDAQQLFTFVGPLSPLP